MLFDWESLALLDEALAVLADGVRHLPDVPQSVDLAQLREPLLAAAHRLQDNAPYHHPRYVAHMQKPPHPVARLAYTLTLWLNPNNHAYDGGRASSIMEQEAIGEIARMVGWPASQGHNPHERLSGVLGAPFRSIAADARGRMDAAAL